MRVIKRYYFKIGGKIPCPEWPSIIKTFMRQQGLSYQKFHYYFEDIDLSRDCETEATDPLSNDMFNTEAQRKRDGETPCHRAVKDFPALGPVLSITGRQSSYKHAVISSRAAEYPCSEEEIIAMLPKLSRKYGFGQSTFAYQDVDFFSRQMPSFVWHLSERFWESKYDPSYLTGSSIIFHRCPIYSKHNGITLFIDVTNGTEILDATPYRDAMAALLPDIKYTECLDCILTIEDEQMYEQLHTSAAPLNTQVSDFFSAVPVPEAASTMCATGLAGTLQKLSVSLGYNYKRSQGFRYHLRKRTARGHHIVVEVFAIPYYNKIDLSLELHGLGFQEHLWDVTIVPRTKNDLTGFLISFFDTLRAAEEIVLPALDAHFPPTPEWFVPNLL